MAEHRLRELEARGVSIWLDQITRRELESGELARLVAGAGLSGVAIDPAALQHAVATANDYQAAIARLVNQGKDPPSIVHDLIIQDVKDAADLLRPLWDRSNGQAGFVSVGLPAWLPQDCPAIIAEAQQFWDAVERPNLMVEIPATTERLPVIRRLLAAGLNVNATLIASLERYQDVVAAFLDAIETRLVRGQWVDRIASVASIPVRSLDAIVDRAIARQSAAITDSAARQALGRLAGKAGVANARTIYARFARIFSPSDDRWDKLCGGGARPQRLLWADTTPGPGRPDVFYVNALIGPRTVDLFSPPTLAAFRQHGEARAETATQGLPETHAVIAGLCSAGVDLVNLAGQLQDAAMQQIEAAYRALLDDVRQRSGEFRIGRAGA